MRHLDRALSEPAQLRLQAHRLPALSARAPTRSTDRAVSARPPSVFSAAATTIPQAARAVTAAAHVAATQSASSTQPTEPLAVTHAATSLATAADAAASLAAPHAAARAAAGPAAALATPHAAPHPSVPSALAAAA
jgi:hypothetical protein